MAKSLVSRAENGAFKALHAVHYRYLYGKQYPGSARVAGWLRAWEKKTGRGDVPFSRAEWESQYAGGGWEFLQGTDELARYSVLTGYLHHLHPGGSVLDVGCGEGLLRDKLSLLASSRDVRYVGVDLSETAVALARARPGAGGNEAFFAGDAETFVPQGRFDAVVFNECLYYFEDPVGTVERYRQYLEEGGTLVVSMFRSRRSEAIQRGLEAVLALVEKVTIQGRKGTWVVSLLAGDAGEGRHRGRAGRGTAGDHPR